MIDVTFLEPSGFLVTAAADLWLKAEL